MEDKNIIKAIEEHKFITAIVVMIFIWGSLLIWFIHYGEAVSKNPCSLCAERMGDDVVCTSQSTIISLITFYENGSVKVDRPEPFKPKGLNSSNFEGVT